MGNDIYFRRIHLPMHVYGFVLLDNSGGYNIYINDNLSPNKTDEAILHELEHIIKSHFYDDTKTIEEKESELSFQLNCMINSL